MLPIYKVPLKLKNEGYSTMNLKHKLFVVISEVFIHSFIFIHFVAECVSRRNLSDFKRQLKDIEKHAAETYITWKNIVGCFHFLWELPMGTLQARYSWEVQQFIVLLFNFLDQVDCIKGWQNNLTESPLTLKDMHFQSHSYVLLNPNTAEASWYLAYVA